MSDPQEKKEESPPVESTEIAEQKLYNLHGGQIELPDGSVTRSKMFDVFEIPLDDYSDIKLTLSELRRVRWQAQKLKYGFQAMAPIHCLGPVKCPFRQNCPFIDTSKKLTDGSVDFTHQDVKKFPLARKCPIEADMLAYRIRKYAEEYEVDPESPTEVGLVCKLAELDVYESRVTQVLSTGDKENEGMDLLKRQVTGIAMNGDEITRLEEHPAFALKEKLHRQRMDILSSLVGTRKEKYKREAALKQRETADPSTLQSDLRKRLESLDKESIIDADFTEQ